MIKVFYWILLLLDSVVYNFVNYAYQIFLLLTKIVIANEDLISPFIKRIYTVIGVIMLFIIAYSFLKAIVSPDNNGVKSMGKVVFNVVKAIILLALIPSLFDFAYAVQDSILSQNTIGRIILGAGDGTNNPADVISRGGIELSNTMLQAFIFPKENGKDTSDIVLEGDNSYTLKSVWDSIDSAQTFRYLTLFSDELAKDEASQIDYSWLISTVAACYILYLLISYCLSLGLRVIKLLFYELFAPIPILASILPNKKDMFNKWLSATLTTYIEVFLRIAIMYLTVYIASLIPKIDFVDTLNVQQTNGMIKSLATACIVMGLFTFVKKAPELIGEITGLDSSKMSAGIKEQLKTGGGLLAAGVIGGAVTSGARNAINGVSRIAATKKNWEEANKLTGKDKHKARLKALGSSVGAGVGSVGSILGGTISGGIRAGKAGKDAGSFADVKDAAKKGSGDAVAAREKRASYKASHGGTIGGAIVGHIKDTGKTIGRWSTGETIEGLQAQSQAMGELSSSYTTFSDGAENLLEKEFSKGSGSLFLSHGFDSIESTKSYKDSSGTKRTETKSISEWYTDYSTAKFNFDNLQAKRNAGDTSITKDVLEIAQKNMTDSRDRVRDILLNLSLSGSENKAFEKLDVKAMAAMKDSLVNAETLKAKVIANASSEVVQGFDKLVDEINKNTVTVGSFVRENPSTKEKEALKDMAKTAQGKADIKIAEMNKENASKGDSK